MHTGNPASAVTPGTARISGRSVTPSRSASAISQTDNGITLPRHYDLRYTQEPQNGSTRAYDWEITADKVITNISLDPANFQIK